MLRLLLITVIAGSVAFLVFRFLARNRPEGTPTKRPQLSTFLIVGLICAVTIMFILPRFGLTAGILLQKALAFLPLVRTFLPF